MIRLIYLVGFLLLMNFSTLCAQNVDDLKSTDADSNKVKLHALLQPSFHNYTNSNLQLNINNLFSYKKKEGLTLLYEINADFIKLLAGQANNFETNFDLNVPSFYNHYNPFQYNFIKSRTRFYYISDINRATW